MPDIVASRSTRFIVHLLRTMAFCALGALFIVLVSPAQADTITVTNTLNDGPGSLRQAILDAAPDDVVVFDPDVFGIGSTIVLSEQLVISKSLTIDGTRTGSLAPTIDATASYHHERRAILVEADTHLTLRSLSITGGAGYSPPTMAQGAGIYNSGVLTITECGFYDNETYDGGAIYNVGMLSISSSMFSNNFAAISAAAIRNMGSLVITNSSFTNNEALGYAGAIANSGTALILSSDISGNRAMDSGGSGSGGAIGNDGNMTIINSTVDRNDSGEGGGIWNAGKLDISDSSLRYNWASGRDSAGGGINNQSIMTATGVEITGNQVCGPWLNGGGGIWNEGQLTLLNATLARNTVYACGWFHQLGGGLANWGTITSIDTTITENRVYSTTATEYVSYSTGNGGGIDNSGTITLINSTVYSNTAGNAADQINTPPAPNSGITAINTIIGGSTYAHKNCQNPIVDGGYNIDNKTSCGFTASTSHSNTNPRLAPLQMNPTFGISVPTMALLKGSPAIDMGNDAVCPPTDARGLARPQGAHCDIGAYEAYRRVLYMPIVRRK